MEDGRERKFLGKLECGGGGVDDDGFSLMVDDAMDSDDFGHLGAVDEV